MLTDRDDDARLRLDAMKASVNDDTDDMLEPTHRTKKIRLSEIYGRRQHEEDLENNDSDSDERNGGRRRSKRKRMAPLKFWKNERPQFERDPEKGVPEVKALIVAAPTPAKRKRPTTNKAKRGGKVKNRSNGYEEENDDGHSYSITKKGLKSIKSLNIEELYEENPNYLYMNASSENQDRAHVWDEQNSMFQEKKVVSHMCTMREMKLPITHERPEGRDGVGLAVQGFNRPQIDKSNIPGWISGHVVLPPLAIKDAEGVGLCSQIFFIAYGQPKSIEIALARADEPQFNELTAQRYLLSPGDNFYIPPNNVYRLENHSASEECKLFWTIVKPWTNNKAKEEQETEVSSKVKAHQPKQVNSKVSVNKQRKIVDEEEESDMESDTAKEAEEEEQINYITKAQGKKNTNSQKSIKSRNVKSKSQNKPSAKIITKKQTSIPSKGKTRTVIIDTRKKAVAESSDESSEEEESEEEESGEEEEEKSDEESEEEVQEEVEIQIPRRKSTNKADINNVYRIGDKAVHNFGSKSGVRGRTAVNVNGRIKHKFQR